MEIALQAALRVHPVLGQSLIRSQEGIQVTLSYAPARLPTEELAGERPHTQPASDGLFVDLERARNLLDSEPSLIHFRSHALPQAISDQQSSS